MPVTGHVFIGIAIAGTGRPAVRGSGRRWWLPLVVVLACLPDLVTQLAWFAGTLEWQDAAHSVIVVLPASVVLALGLSRWLKASWARIFLLVVVCLATHDLLDLLHGARRPVFWPFSSRVFGSGDPGRNPHLVIEVLLYSGLAGSVWGIRLLLSRWRRSWGETVAATPFFSGGWPAGGLTACILFAALAVNHYRGVREAAFARSQELLAARRFDDALAEIDEANRWPQPIRPSRLDYARAEISLAMGDRRRAEEYYLRSVASDPAYFWAVADLADFYASSGGSAEERRRLASPYVQMLSCSFADFQACPRYLARINRKLAH